jgi:fructose-1,6-bisphosphatase/sedoheptulose 1,7-bisphosphatase-like protein
LVKKAMMFLFYFIEALMESVAGFCPAEGGRSCLSGLSGAGRKFIFPAQEMFFKHMIAQPGQTNGKADANQSIDENSQSLVAKEHGELIDHTIMIAGPGEEVMEDV